MKHKVFDAYPEKQLQDASPDKIASSSAMLNEVNGLVLMGLAGAIGARRQPALSHSELNQLEKEIENSRMAMNSRDGIALCSIAFCSPLMLFGVGATLAIADEFRMVREAGLRNRIDAARLYPLRKSFLASDEMGRTDRATDTFKLLTETDTLKSRLKLTKTTNVNDKNLSKAARDKLLCSGDYRAVQIQKLEQSWLKADKILKQKQQLIDWLENNRDKLDLKTVSGVRAKIEQLDKAQKRLGC